jgi:hypothetical protein
MQMARLSVSLGEHDEAEISSIQASLDALKATVHGVLDSDPAAGDGCFNELAASLEELGADPSAAAVMRQALEFFVASLRRADRIADLEAGYRAMARDEDRAGVSSSMRGRLPDRFRED